jgi:hypothetical protein
VRDDEGFAEARYAGGQFVRQGVDEIVLPRIALPLKNIAEPMRAYSLEVGVPAPAKPAEPATPAAPTPQKRRFGLAPLAAALAALLIVIAGGAWWFLNANRPVSVATKTPAEAAHLSIVVAPS